MKNQLDKWMTEYLHLLEQEEDPQERSEMYSKYLHVRRNYELFCKDLDSGKCFFCSECGVVEHTSKNLSDKYPIEWESHLKGREVEIKWEDEYSILGESYYKHADIVW